MEQKTNPSHFRLQAWKQQMCLLRVVLEAQYLGWRRKNSIKSEDAVMTVCHAYYKMAPQARLPGRLGFLRAKPDFQYTKKVVAIRTCWQVEVAKGRSHLFLLTFISQPHGIYTPVYTR